MRWWRWTYIDHVASFLNLDGPLVIAHRGGAALACENSDTAFARSVGLGVRVLESDIRTTADGVPILHHDADLTRVAHYGAKIEDIDWDEISGIRLPDDGRLMRLDEALTAWPGIRWNLDVKDDRSVQPTVDTLLRTQALDRVCVSSFSNGRLIRLRAALGARVATGATWREALAILRVPVWRGRMARNWRGEGDVGPVAVQVPPSHRGLPLLTRGSVAAAHELGLAVQAWTINSADQMQRLLEMGVDGLVTDDPALALEVLAAATTAQS